MLVLPSCLLASCVFVVPALLKRKLKCTAIKWISQGLQQVHNRAGSQTPTSFSLTFILPIWSWILACCVPAVSCWESPSVLSQVHLVCAFSWSPSNEVRSEFSLSKNSVQLLDRKIWWVESQSDMGKEGEKASGCCRRCSRCGLGNGFVPHCKNPWIYSVLGVNTWQCTPLCW